MKLRWIAAIAAFGLAVVACGGNATRSSKDPSTMPPAAGPVAYHPTINPADFTTTIDNPFLPLVPGTRRVYEARSPDGLEQIVIDVTRETKTVMGVTCVVVRDTVTVDGKVLEDTFDWYAQDRGGSVWYFGEATKRWENGVVSTEGSWEGGVDGAQPGIVMPADPQVGGTYRQEFYAGHAEDMTTILSVDKSETVTVPFGTMRDMVMTADYSPLDSGLVEHKYFARGIGNALVLHVKGPPERLELIRVEQF